MDGKEEFERVEGIDKGTRPDAASLGPPVSPFTTTAHRVADRSDPAQDEPPSDVEQEAAP